MDSFNYATPEEAEDAFYWAFEHADVTAMMRVWADQQSIECVHPMGRIVRGPEAVMRSWEQIFAVETRMDLRIAERRITRDSILSIHTLYEHVTVTDSNQVLQGRVAATNVYQLTDQGWRMVLHHASPTSRVAPEQQTPETAPLH